jgi:hypothetical protein
MRGSRVVALEGDRLSQVCEGMGLLKTFALEVLRNMHVRSQICSAAFFAVLFSFVLSPLASGATQSKASEPPGLVLFEMTTLNWGISNSGGCKSTLDFRLYADGRVEYDQCRKRTLESGGEAEYLVRKEAKAEKKDIDELMKLIQDSGFLEAIGPAHSGLNGTDVGWNTTLTYRDNCREKRLEIRNYVPESKTIPEWLHKIVNKARSLTSEQE